MKQSILVLVFIALLCLLSAQNSVFNPNPNSLTGSISSSLLNPYKLKMSHSMGFSAGTSSMGKGFYESRYTNHLQYEFSSKLNLNLDLNLINYGTALSGKGFSFDSNNDNKTKIIPEFSLKYNPSDNISIRLEYKNLRNDNPWFRHTADWLE
jgi:opacity protein-like surface antigen